MMNESNHDVLSIDCWVFFTDWSFKSTGKLSNILMVLNRYQQHWHCCIIGLFVLVKLALPVSVTLEKLGLSLVSMTSLVSAKLVMHVSRSH
jgi:hypothetical protein